jgi:hypothetical protein
MGLPLLAGGDTGRAAARRKGSVVPIPGGASQRAREVVLGLGVAAKEAGTSQLSTPVEISPFGRSKIPHP